MKKVVFQSLIFLFSLNFYSCNQKQVEISKPLSQAKSISKEDFKNSLKETSIKLHNNAIILRGTSINEAELALLLNPSIENSRLYLANFEITDEDILEEMPLDDPRIIEVALTVYESENKSTPSILLRGGPDVYDCVLRSFGISAVIDLVNGKIEKAAIKQVIKKVATKYLGVIGAAWALYEFGDCMGYF